MSKRAGCLMYCVNREDGNVSEGEKINEDDAKEVKKCTIMNQRFVTDDLKSFGRNDKFIPF